MKIKICLIAYNEKDEVRRYGRLIKINKKDSIHIGLKIEESLKKLNKAFENGTINRELFEKHLMG